MRFLNGNIYISSPLCWVIRSFAQFTRRWRSFCSSGLNVASAVDSQTHKGSYIYRINDTLHPPHNSCLLHLADWDCRPAPIRRAPWLNSWGSFMCVLLSRCQKSTLTLPCKSKHSFRPTDCVRLWEARPPLFCSAFHFLMLIGHLIHVSAWCVSETEQGLAQRWRC